MKGALAVPLGAAADQPIEQLKHKLGNSLSATVAASSSAIGEGRTHLQAAFLHTGLGPAGTTGDSSAAGPRSSPGKQSALPGAADLAAPTRFDDRYSRPLLRRILREAAVRHGLEPKLVLALSFWESGWDQSRVSVTGAVGLMQVEPDVADQAGPSLLGRRVDVSDPYDNADVGAAIFKEDLDNFGNPAMALAAYYQGPDSVRQNEMFPDTQQYVQGILELAARMTD